MKTLTIDFDLYQEELSDAKRSGHISGFSLGEDLIIRLLTNIKDGASAETVYNIIISEMDDDGCNDFALKCAKIFNPNFNIGEL